jgi:quercetin dioxygenase-like cupin family protein
LDTFGTRAEAEAARGERGTVVESLGRVWLFTIAEAAWRPSTGVRVGRAGPFAMISGRSYIARYMEAVLPPGIPSVVHRHTGGEAWYVAEGAQCLETPDSTIIVRAGQTAFVPQGPPMMLLGIGTEVRRTVVAVVHDADQPWMVMASDWAPRGTCPK